jgi:hypothetical protein
MAVLPYTRMESGLKNKPGSAFKNQMQIQTQIQTCSGSPWVVLPEWHQ